MRATTTMGKPTPKKSDSKATEAELRKSLQALQDVHGCSGECRTCDYAWNLLNDEPDNGEGVGERPTFETLSGGLPMVFTTGELRFVRTEDHVGSSMRLYKSFSTDLHEHGWTGEELDALTAWWAEEKLRTGTTPDEE